MPSGLPRWPPRSICATSSPATTSAARPAAASMPMTDRDRGPRHLDAHGPAGRRPAGVTHRSAGLASAIARQQPISPPRNACSCRLGCAFPPDRSGSQRQYRAAPDCGTRPVTVHTGQSGRPRGRPKRSPNEQGPVHCGRGPACYNSSSSWTRTSNPANNWFQCRSVDIGRSNWDVCIRSRSQLLSVGPIRRRFCTINAPSLMILTRADEHDLPGVPSDSPRGSFGRTPLRSPWPARRTSSQIERADTTDDTELVRC